MWKARFAPSHFVVKITLLLLLLFVCSACSLLLYNLVETIFFDDKQSLLLLQAVQSFGLFVLPAILTAYLCTNSTKVTLKLDVKPKWELYVWVALLMVSAIPSINLLAWLNEQITFPQFMSGIELWLRNGEEDAKILTEEMLKVNSLSALFVNLLVIAVLPAISEEFFFRGTLQSVLSSWRGAVVALWIVAFVFSAIHMQFYGFIPRMLLGALFGYMVYWGGGMGIVVLAHFVNNAIAIVFYYLKYNYYTQFPLDTIGVQSHMWVLWQA
jgi:uncharacterized protein